jgi:glutamate N-acetyltransferase / amino-acid N-acetyltransferase
MKTAIKSISGGVTAVPGFLASGVHCGIKKTGARDLALIYSKTPCTAAGLFTTNRITAAPVRLSQEHLKSGRLQAIIANSGNANACTGPRGETVARQMAEVAARHLGIAPEQVAVASTGVIGEPPPLKALLSGIPRSVKVLSPKGSRNAARAIMTTDRSPKEAALRVNVGGRMVTLGGIAKGSGMIHPNMATMLAFLTTDLKVEPSLLREMLASAVNRSFNMITVDGETSTNDMVLCLANGQAKNPDLQKSASALLKFQAALDAVCIQLAKRIVRDGEGATKLVEVRVESAVDHKQAKTVALRVANSSLVKTAFFGEDANWGRIMAAIGAAGVEVDPNRIRLFLDHERLVENGVGLGPSADREAAKVLKKKSFTLAIDLGAGNESATAWTCDLSYDYIKINAAYRT